jgi:hypothetical protein
LEVVEGSNSGLIEDTLNAFVWMDSEIENAVRTACTWIQMGPGISQSQVRGIRACSNCSMTLGSVADNIQRRSCPGHGNGSSMLLEDKKKNSMVWVRERTVPTERQPLVGEVIANFCG